MCFNVKCANYVRCCDFDDRNTCTCYVVNNASDGVKNDASKTEAATDNVSGKFSDLIDRTVQFAERSAVLAKVKALEVAESPIANKTKEFISKLAANKPKPVAQPMEDPSYNVGAYMPRSKAVALLAFLRADAAANGDIHGAKSFIDDFGCCLDGDCDQCAEVCPYCYARDCDGSCEDHDNW